jgi:hypothetical protein
MDFLSILGMAKQSYPQHGSETKWNIQAYPAAEELYVRIKSQGRIDTFA